MQRKHFALIFVVAVLAMASTVGLACEGEKKCGSAEDCTKAATLADLATKAEGGCEHSKTALIAKAKEAGCEEIAALAVKAEGGCEKSTAALIAKVKGCGEHAYVKHAKSEDPSVVMLASHAEQGCKESQAALIAKFKEHGCEESKALAVAAEGGCDKSMDKLIAMAKESEKKEAKTE
jgi:hypothetical protein